MANDSTTGGPLLPIDITPPLEGEALVDFFVGWALGVTGMPDGSIRPRWQPEPPDIPADGTDWAALGIQDIHTDAFSAVTHNRPILGVSFKLGTDILNLPGASSYDTLRRHEELTLLISFYGPRAHHWSSLLRDGVQIAQNLELLAQNDMGLIETKDLIVAPDLIKEKWLYRVDLPIRIRRRIIRNYPVFDVGSVSVTLNNESYTVPINEALP